MLTFTDGLPSKAGATWVSFVAALCLALPQPPRLSYVLAGAAIAAILIPIGFVAARRAGRQVAARVGAVRVRLAVAALVAGTVLGAALLAVLAWLVRFEPELRTRFAARLGEPGWRPWALAFESSILEETVFRLFALSVIAWLAGLFIRVNATELTEEAERAEGKSPQRNEGNEDSRERSAPLTPFLRGEISFATSGSSVYSKSRSRAFYIGLVGATILFGLAHLPAWSAAAHGGAILFTLVVLLNGVGGLMFGWVYWRWGLAYAIFCHFAGDVVIQSLGPRVLG